MKEKLIEIWLWTVAISAATIMFCTAVAWVAGIIYFVVRWCNG